MSPSQRGMLFDALSLPGGVHVEQSVLALPPDADLDAFAEAWRVLVRTHATLRTAFLWTDVEEPLQVVYEDAVPEIAQPGAPLDEYLAADRARGFDMSVAPLMRVALLRDPEGWKCVWTHHHILLDGWSVPLLARDLFAAYDALRNGETPSLTPPRPYRDYIQWLKQQDAGEAERFWRASLAGIAKPTLGIARGRGSFAEERLAFAREECEALRATMRRHRLPLNVLFHGLWSLLLGHYSGETRVVFGATISGRPETLRGVESMIGLFINTIPVTATIDRALPMTEWLMRLHDAQSERERFGWCAAGQIHEWSEVPRGLPLFDSLLVFENFPDAALPRDAATLGAHTRYPLNILVESGRDLTLTAIHRNITNAAAILDGIRFLARLFVAEPHVDLGTMLDALHGRPQPHFERGAARELRPPKTPAQAEVLAVWRDVLGVEVGITDDFFEAGGHSLLATQIVSRLGIPLRAIFDHPTVAELAAYAGEASAVAIPRAERREQLSFAQERLWFLAQLDPASAAYNVQAALRLRGALDVDALERALRAIVERHEILRTTFPSVDGRPYANAGESNVALRREDVDPAAELLRPFDLANGPLVRFVLTPDQTLIVTLHHIITDGWSNHIFFRELAALYEGASLAPLPIQYGDYAAWQHTWDLDALLEHWKAKLEGAPALLPLPADMPRPAMQQFRGDMVGAELDASTTAQLAELARGERATTFMVLLAAFAAALKRWSGEEDLVIGTPIANRNHRGVEELIGFFVNTLALRIDAAHDPTFRELLRRVRATALDAYAHQDLPFERLVEELAPRRDLSHNPLFQVFFNMLNVPDAAPRLGELDVEPIALPELVTRFDLTLYAIERDARIRFELVYDTALFRRETAERMLAQLCALLRDAAAKPEASVHALGTLPSSAADGAGVFACGRRDATCSAGDDAGVPLHARFLEHAQRVPHALAIIDPNRSYTYAQLDAASDAIAVGDGVHAIPVEANASLVINILAALKASRPFVVGAAVHAPVPPGTAYVVRTSGTTGAPLEIAGGHAPVVHFLRWHIATHRLTADDRFSLLSGTTHDPLLRDIFTPLSLGASLHIPPADVRLSRELGTWMNRERITVAHLTPAIGELLDGEIPSLRWLFFGGDRLTYGGVARMRRVAPNARIVNFYGTTETPQAMSSYLVEEDDDPRRGVPIGRGIDDVELLLLNEANERAMVGELAEICVRTPYLSLGLGDMYRTGDLGRCRADGNVEIFGRRDRQLKLRGFRIEPREIEAALEQHPGVREAAVIAIDDTLVAFVTGGEVRRSWLAGRLPEHLIPSRIVTIDAIPLTRNGKLDTTALREIRVDERHEPPANEKEEAILAIWRDVLGTQLGVTDDFFERGGHSLKATRVISRIERDLGIRIPLRDLFRHPTVRALCGILNPQASSLKPQSGTIPRIPDAETYAVSPAQRRLWTLSQLAGSAYNMNRVLLVEGAFDATSFERALREISMRHESLRTTFEMTNGELRQRVHAAPHFAFSMRDATESDAHALAEADARAPFDLERGPLMRVSVLRIGGERHIILFSIHHIAADAWSLDVLVRELGDAYDGRTLPPPRLQYRDYAAWQNARPLDDAYWREKLAAPLPVLDLPADRTRPPVKTGRGKRVPFRVDANALTQLARTHGASLYMLLVAAFDVLLHRYSGAEDIIVGGAVAGRAHADLESQIGFYANMLALRVGVEPELPFTELLERVREVATEAYEHQDVPFDALVGALNVPRDTSRTPLFDVVVVLQNAGSTDIRLGDARVTQLEQPAHTAKFDLNFTFEENGVAFLEYSTDLFDEDRAERMTEHLTMLLASIAEDAARSVATLNLLPEDERRLVVETFNDTDAAFPDTTIDALFRARAAAQPDAPAVLCDDRTLTYGQLAARATEFARELRACGVRRGDFVGVRLERDENTIVALLGILTAGAAYVPVDASYPEERIEFIFEDAGCVAIVESGAAGFSPPKITSAIRQAKACRSTEADPAYVIYTSGSTGKPKGCVVTHRNVVRLLINDRFPFDFSERDTWIVAHSFAFDFSVWEMYGALLYGGRLVVARRDDVRNPATLRALLRRHRVTVLNQTPASFYALTEIERDADVHDLDRHLRLVIFGGDKLDPARLRDWVTTYPLERVRLVNMYGITETTVHVTYGPLAHEHVFGDAGSPIGAPLPETRVYVLDAHRNPQPIGVPGELYIGGSGVCAGYLHRPELNAQRFVDTRFGRLYRSGDVGRWNADGTLRYHGRNDHQVQLRGYRIELGEIERVLEGAIVRVVDDRLVAWVRGDVESLRARARTQLPEYMVPSQFVAIDAVPLTGNGKIDYAKLPVTQTPIRALWQELLHRDDIGDDDNFFDLGGHSLLLVQMHRRLREMGVDVELVDLFRYPTIRALECGDPSRRFPSTEAKAATRVAALQIAVIGLATRLPGAADANTFWRNLRGGVESSVTFTDDELRAAGIAPQLIDDPRYVRTKPLLDGIELFDAEYFGISPAEAAVMDPQHRIFLECAVEALDDAGYGDAARERVGVFAGASFNSYLLNNLLGRRDLLETLGVYPLLIGNDRDFVASRVSYKLDLRGPAINVSTACSTSLVAVHLACRSLRDGECDLALAGGVSVKVPQVEGYLYDQGGILSPDGRCRAFDASANGTVGGSGAGIVVLKRLDDALRDGDRVMAIIKATAIGNDGAEKVGYTAPSVGGQAAVIAEAHRLADVDPESITYVETHGTGTSLGDPIEIAALTQAFRARTEKRGFCAIGSVKTNIGHLDAAAGVAGLIKAVLALDRGEIPPSLNFESPNPNIDFDGSPFFVNTQTRTWPRGETPRRAGVSSFGLGGTNVHVVLEEAPLPAATSDARPLQLVPISARTATALETLCGALASSPAEQAASRRPADADIAYTLAVGRKHHDHRAFFVTNDPRRLVTGKRTRNPHVVFLFPGGGAQYAEMGNELYRHERVYREAIDRCGVDIAGASENPSEALPALFAVEWALAQLWRSWGIEPHALIGHSLGEYAAACIAGVFSVEDALALVKLRGRLFETIEAGEMLSVPLSRDELVLDDTLSIAAINLPDACVVSGGIAHVRALENVLAGRGIETRRLHIAVAAHSPLVEPILDEFRCFVATLERNAPSIPILSNLTGTILTANDARDPDYWTRHLRHTVRFADGAAELLRDRDAVFVECGPGNTLASFVQRHPARDQQLVVHSMRHPHDTQSDYAVLLNAAGHLWIEGAPLDWKRFYADQRRTRVSLPPTVFERKPHWVDANAPVRKPVAEWFYRPTWKRAAPAIAPAQADLIDPDLQTLLRVADAKRHAERLTVLLTNVHDITGDEPLDPERAMLLGAIKVLNQELPKLRIDVAGAAIRGAYEWQLDYEPVRLDGEPRLRRNGTYVITGGTGGVGRLLAKYLRDAWAAKVITISRSSEADFQADVADEARLREAFDAIGPFDAVIHAAGITRGGSIFVPFEELRDEDIEAQLRPKMHGTRALARVLEGRSLDFVLLLSSNASVLGGLGLAAYAAANQFLDTFAALQNRTSEVPWISANWDGWPVEGAEARGEFAMSLPEAHEAFRRVTSARGQVVVSAGDLHARLSRFVSLEGGDPSRRFDSTEGKAATAVAALQTDVESRLTALWREMLGTDVALHDNFFELRGDSLLGTRMVTRANALFGVDLPLRSLFEEPTVAGLAARIEAKLMTHAQPPLVRVPDAPLHPLSHSQRRVWLLSQIAEASVAYNVPLSLRLEGALDVEALRSALAQIVARHESLRTSFVETPEGPMQRIEDLAFELPLREMSESQAEARRRELALQPFDLTRAPLLHGELLRIGEQRYVLALVLHHIVCDGWSLSVIARELSALYARESLPPLRIHYRDFAAWQRAAAKPAKLRLPNRPLELPADYPRPSIPRFRGRLMTFDVPHRDALRALAGSENATLFMLLVAIVKVLLHRYSGQEEIVVGAPVAGRAHEQLHDQVGLYLNTIVLADRVAPSMTFRELLRAVRATALDAYAREDVPFDLLAEQAPRDLSRAPLTDVLVMMQNAGRMDVRIDGVAVQPLAPEVPTSKIDLTFDFADEDGRLMAGIRYSTDLFADDRIERMAAHFCRLIESVVAEPSQTIGEIDILPTEERTFLAETVNATAVDGDDPNVVRLFEAQADRTPDAIAVSCEDESLTYRQLDARANFVARTLPRGALIGVSLERGVDLVVALLAVLKAGSAYVPLDPGFPAKRLALMIEDAHPALVLRDVPRGECERAVVDITGEDLAYVLYTSGSTGMPKGVEIPHRALANLLLGFAHLVEPPLTLSRGDDEGSRTSSSSFGDPSPSPRLQDDGVTLLALTTISFDIAALELFLPLIAGARVEIARTTNDAAKLMRQIENADLVQATPSLWRMLVAAGWNGSPRTTILCGGETLPADLAAELVQRAPAVFNLYGPTETTIWSAAHRVTGEPLIGKPIRNTRFYVLDAERRLLPIGVPGELYIAGRGLARGYRNQPELTAERFVDDPFVSGETMYRTGDVTRVRADGNFEIHGRIDHQLKVRGYRVEAGDVEAALLSHDGVADAVAVLRDDALVAYVAGRPDLAALRAHLAERVPPYMIPAAIVRVDALPRNASGKVDRARLPQPERDVHAGAEPRDALEHDVARVWADELGRTRLGIHDHFFEQGGHSLSATRALFRLQRERGVDAALIDMFRHPTVAAFAAAVRDRAPLAPLAGDAA